MPLVFVHGVATRDTDEYQKRVAERRHFLKQTVLKSYLRNEDAKTFFPMWGESVPEFPKDNPIIPLPKQADDFVSFGFNAEAIEDEFPAARIVTGDGSETPLLDLARQSIAEFVDLLIDRTLQHPDVRGITERENEVIALGIRASQFLADDPDLPCIDEAADDDEFVTEFLGDLDRWDKENLPFDTSKAIQAFGVGSRVLGWVKRSATRLRASIIDVPNNAILQRVRPGLTSRMVKFFGDVFYYQGERGDANQPGEIPQIVLSALREAREIADQDDEALIVMGHSMGGNILYDTLTHFDPDLRVDALITVGSQASVFKQLGLFKLQSSRDDQVSTDGKLPAPPNVAHWLNVFDTQDPLSFTFEPAFDGVTDFLFESPGGLTSAHGDYFKRIRFYERLTDRLSNLG